MTGSRLVALRYPNRRLAARIGELWEAGDAVLPLSPYAPDREIAAMLSELRPHQIEDESGAARLDDGLPVGPGIALVMPTSGSSGRPKGVEISFDALDWSARAYAARLKTVEGARWLCCLPLSHIGGLGILVRSRLAGTEPVIHDRFEPGLIAQEHEATLISLVPTALIRLLDEGVDLSRYSTVLIGGAALSPDVADRARKAGVQVVQTYGLTETCGGCNFDGFALPGAEFALDGERILVRGPMLMDGYRLRPDLTAEAIDPDGWLNTSDRGRLRTDGALEVLGRMDDIIVTGGQKVSAPEVETELKAHPQVADAAVAGISDYRWGQAVAALIVPGSNGAPTLLELKGFLAERLAAFKAPKRILIVEQIPRTASGKIRRQAVRDLLEASE
jgi:o-succinylbenzoate---CoA ligase